MSISVSKSMSLSRSVSDISVNTCIKINVSVNTCIKPMSVSIPVSNQCQCQYLYQTNVSVNTCIKPMSVSIPVSKTNISINTCIKVKASANTCIKYISVSVSLSESMPVSKGLCLRHCRCRCIKINNRVCIIISAIVSVIISGRCLCQCRLRAARQ